MRTYLASSVLGLVLIGTVAAAPPRGAYSGGAARPGFSIGIGSGFSPGYRSGYGYGSPYRGSGISFSIGSPGYSNYYRGGYATPGIYGRQSYYQPGFYSASPGVSIGIGRTYSRPYASWHQNWQPASWNWSNRPTYWSIYTGDNRTRVYANPYIVGTPITVGTVNYSQPLPEAPTTVPTVNAAAMQYFTDARASFKDGEYKRALAQVDQAIQKVPEDSTLHEFRALCLFALRDYKQASQVIYPVLAAGPGWDWDTIRSMYRDNDAYTAQLRALEDYYRANKTEPSASFLLAYHYLALDYPQNAATHLKNVISLLPNDKLAPALLKAIE